VKNWQRIKFGKSGKECPGILPVSDFCSPQNYGHLILNCLIFAVQVNTATALAAAL